MKNRKQVHDNWATPPDYKDKVYKEYGIDFDPCPWNHDLKLWDGLRVEWGSANFINPPYATKLKADFVNRALDVALSYGSLCFLLLPVSTSTKLFHEVLKPFAKEINFIKGRLRFIGINAKGQHVNYDQIQTVTKETILYEGKEIPKYIRASGQFDNMEIIF